MKEYLGYLGLFVFTIVGVVVLVFVLMSLGVILYEFLGLVLFLCPLILGGVIALLVGSTWALPIAVGAIAGQIVWARYWFRNITW
jgi:hypothetical protein